MLTRSLLSLSAVMLSTSCTKNQYELQMRLVSDGKEIARPNLIVTDGEKASITEQSNNKKTQIEIIAKELNNSLSLDVNLKTEEVEGASKTLQSGNFLINLTANQKALVNFKRDPSSAGNFISTFEVTARKSTAAPAATDSRPVSFRKLTDLK